MLEMFALKFLFGIDIDNIDVLMMLRSPWMSLVLVLATTLTLILGLFEVHVKTADLATDVSNFSEYWKQKQVRKWHTLQETNIAMDNPPFWWYLPGKMGIFMGYVSFREGISYSGIPWNLRGL